jgi:flagellar assembly factor FliW
MPEFATRDFGTIRYEAEAALDFPQGLPAFEHCRRFLPLTVEVSEPLVFLQSLEDSSLCFLTVPIQVVDRDYQLRMDKEDLELVGFSAGSTPRVGEEVLCLAVVSIREQGPTANLLAPIVINLQVRRGVQAVGSESGYSHQHPLLPAEAESGIAAEPCACGI